MASNPVIWLLAAGLAQGVFLAAALPTLNARNKTAGIVLAALVGVMTLMIAGEFLDALDAPFDFSIGLAVELAIGPLIYLFARAVSDPDFQFGQRHTFHFLPLLAAIAALGGLQAIFDGRFTMSNHDAAPFIVGWTFAKIPYFFAYAWASDRVFARALPSARRARHALLGWIRRWFEVLYIFVALLYLDFILFVIGAPAAPEPDVVGALGLAATVFSIGYIVLANRRLLDRPVDAKPAEIALAARAEASLREAGAFADPDFSLSRLAAALAVDETKLAAALNARYDGGFQEILNRVRIDVFDALIRERANRGRTILDLAMEAGFNSKATFYRAFKTAKGRTPTAYRAQLIEKSHDSSSHPAK